MRRVKWTKTLEVTPTAFAGQGVGDIKAGTDALISDELAARAIEAELAEEWKDPPEPRAKKKE